MTPDNPDVARHDATQLDMSRHDATEHDTRNDNLHTMTLRELETKVAEASIAISYRSLQRHCEAGTFDAKLLPATNNRNEWFIAPASVEKGIADLKALREHRARRAPTSQPSSQPAATLTPPNDTSRHDATEHDVARHDATATRSEPEPQPRHRLHSEPYEDRYVKLLESENLFLRDQVQKKDEQLSSLSERFNETQGLLGAMQRMFAPLLGQSDPFKKPSDPTPRDIQTGNQ